MQSVSFRIWTHVAASISYDDNDYTTGTSLSTNRENYVPPLRHAGSLSYQQAFKHLSFTFDTRRTFFPSAASRQCMCPPKSRICSKTVSP